MPGPTAAHPATTRVQPPSHNGLRLMLLATMAVWGGNVPVMKLLLAHMDPLALSVLRMLSALVVLCGWLAWQQRAGRIHRASASGDANPAGPAAVNHRPTRRTALALAGCGLLMVYLNQLSFTWGVQQTAAANAALIIALNPLVSSLGAALLLGDRLTPRRVAGVVLGFAGVAAVVLHRPGVALGTAGLGDLLVLASVLTWVGGGVLVQRVARQVDTAWISAIALASGTAALLLHVGLDAGTRVPDVAHIPLWVWPTVAASGIAASAIGALVWNRGLQVLGVARTALFAYWVPIFGVGLAVLVLGEPLTLWHAIGLAAVLAGTWLDQRR